MTKKISWYTALALAMTLIGFIGSILSFAGIWALIVATVLIMALLKGLT